MGPPRTPFSASDFNLVLDLPGDLEVWTPEDVPRYLGRVVKARTISGGEGTLKPGNGGHNSNEPSASDLATFVREKQIGGRGFMRMSEADLDGYVFSLCFYIHRPLRVFIGRNYCPFPYGGRTLPTRKRIFFEFSSSTRSKFSPYSLLSSILIVYFQHHHCPQDN